MIATLNLAALVVATMFAAAAAVTCNWLLLRVALQLMQPAAAKRPTVRTELVRGTAELARVFAPYR